MSFDLQLRLKTQVQRIEELEERVRKLEGLVERHHAFGILDGFAPGENCPVCEPGSTDFVEGLRRICDRRGST